MSNDEEIEKKAKALRQTYDDKVDELEKSGMSRKDAVKEVSRMAGQMMIETVRRFDESEKLEKKWKKKIKNSK